MSTGLFRSRPLRRGRNLKQLTISAPLPRRGSSGSYSAPSPIVEATRHVVLAMMYSFTGQSKGELTCPKGTYLKFISRVGSGWLEVETVAAPICRGFVPASYVSIVVNNAVDPITLEWLQAMPHPVAESADTSDTSDTFANMSANTSADISANSTDNTDACSVASSELFDFENVYPETVKVDKLVKGADGLEFCFCLSMHRHDTLYISKSVAEFVALDHSWNQGAVMFGSASGIDVSVKPVPPSFPQLPTAHDTASLFHYCQQVNHYWHEVLKMTQLKRSQQLAHFIGSAMQVVCREGKVMSDADITRTLFGDDVDVVLRMAASASAVHTPIESSFDSDDSDTYRHYSSGSDSLFSRLVKSQTVPTTPVTSHNQHQEFPDTPNTPPMDTDVKRVVTPEAASKSPLQPAQEAEAAPAPAGPPPGPPRRQSKRGVEPSEYLKIKIHIQNEEDDVIVLKIKRTNLISVVYLKKLVSHKIYKDYSLIDHYALTPVGQDPLDDDGLLAWLKTQQKAVLNLQRLRRKNDASDK